jgi:MOSC domain-containing protein YiiM
VSDAPLKDLLATVPATGRVEAILVRPSAHEEAVRLPSVEMLAGRGLAGDRRAAGPENPTAKRHVTLVQAEHIEVVARLLDRPVIPEQLRRNLVVSRINLQSLRDRRFAVGDVVLEGTGHCHPCSQMEERLGIGGYQAMRGHGGITARIITPGVLHVGDAVTALELRPAGTASDR